MPPAPASSPSASTPDPGSEPRRALEAALALFGRGEGEAAANLCREVLRHRPEDADALHLLGFVLLGQGRAGEAVGFLRRAVAIHAGNPSAHANLGRALAALGDRAGARAAFRRALELNPGFAEAHLALADLLMEEDAGREALFHYRAAARGDPGSVPAWRGLGAALARAGRAEEAEAALARALELSPGDAGALVNLGNVHALARRASEAAECYARALALEPANAEALNNLGEVLRDLGRHAEAVRTLERAVALHPDSAPAHNTLGNRLRELGRLAEAEAAYRRALELDPGFAVAYSNLLLALCADPAATGADLLAEARRWAAAHAKAPSPPPVHANRPEPGRRLRVGYVSPDFRDHAVANFLMPLLRAHDRDAVEVFCYAEVPAPDAVTERFRATADGWRETVGLDDDAVARQVRADGVDILVDLAGHTGGNRLLAFARRPAPVQVTWLGYGSTTGLAQMDYRLTDAVVDPEGAADAHYVERLVRLDACFQCYAPPADAPEVSPPPVERAGRVAFGSFNALSKVNDAVIAAWARLLEAVPGSRLVLKDRTLGEEETRDALRARFAARGVAPERLEFLAPPPTTRAHLALYARVDVALDTFPYNGATTTCEALLMGVPVVTLAGERFVARMGAGFLARLGLDDLVAASAEEYVERAASLARDRARLADLRAGLRARLLASPVCDAPAFARAVEAAYRDLWRRWCTARSGEA